MEKEQEKKDFDDANASVVDHILIRDGESKEVILNRNGSSSKSLSAAKGTDQVD